MDDRHGGIRIAAVLGLLSALLVLPASVEALLVHDHDGHDVHAHALTPGPDRHDQRHEHSQHADPPAPEEAGSVVVLEALAACPRTPARSGLRSGMLVPGSAASVSPAAVAGLGAEPDPRNRNAARPPHPPPDPTLVAILRGSHALLF